MIEALLRECFVLRDGVLHWLERPLAHFGCEKECRRWNSRYAFHRVGIQQVKGYGRVRFTSNGKRMKFAEHRLVFLLANGYLPAEVDHRDVDSTNNAPDNLRAADSRLNKGNTLPRAKHGFKGVCYEAARRKWRAFIRTPNGRVNLGRFDQDEDAARAYALAAVTVFGEFARA